MAEDDDPGQLHDKKGRFAPGHKRIGGRTKGTENKFGPNLRAKLLNGIAKAGLRKAKKAGVNTKIDGVEYYIEDLAVANGTAAATLISKLIPPEQPKSEFSGSGTTINIHPIAAGTFFSREACRELSETGRLPPDAFITLLNSEAPKVIESIPMRVDEAMETIVEEYRAPCRPKLDNVVPLRQLESPVGSDISLEARVEALSPQQRQMLTAFFTVPGGRGPLTEAQMQSKLEAMPRSELVVMAKILGLPEDDFGLPDTVA